MKNCLLLAVLTALVGGHSWAVDREAFTITRYQLEVQIDRTAHVMAVTGRVTLRNETKAPQKNPVLQVSSSLSWNGVAFAEKPVEWIGNDYTSDIDHTGGLSEVIVTLPSPVPPGGSVALDVQYGGTVTSDATRLTRMGAPGSIAARNDWDQISESFTAVRGLGHVVWYPVSLPAVSLSDGAAVFAAIGEWKIRHRNSRFDAQIHIIGDDGRLCIAGTAMAATCGEIGQASDPRTGGMISQVTNSIRLSALGETTPSFAVANYVRLERPGVTVFHNGSSQSLARDYAATAEANDSVLDVWLGPPTTPVVAIELEDANANPYQDGSLLFTPLRQTDPATLSLLLIPAQVAARFASARRWIEDGLQRFVQAVAVERRVGRKGALQFLNEYLPAMLSTSEALDPNAATGQKQPADALLSSSDEVVLRGKGAFVFWMLRDMLGDAVLQRALAAYRSASDVSPAYFQGLLEEGHKRDLEWFFDDWVYRDRGLPEFHVENVYARPVLEDPKQLSFVTVTIENRGGAGAEVPVLIETSEGERAIRVVAPAHQKVSGRSQLPGAPTRVTVNDGSVPVRSSEGSTYAVPERPKEP
jgi:hypothetical protein